MTNAANQLLNQTMMTRYCFRNCYSKHFLSVLFLLSVHLGFGQHFRIVHWGIEQGLSQGINLKIMQDARGFLWMTSYEGVNRFDGKTFRNFYASANKNAIHGWETTGLVEDARRRIWIGSGEGLNCYDPVIDSVMHFLPERSPQSKRFYSIPLAATKEEVICYEISGKIVAYHTTSLAKRIITNNLPWHNNYTTAINCWLDEVGQQLWMPAEYGIANIDLKTGRTNVYFRDLQVNALLYDMQKDKLMMGTNTGLMEWNVKDKASLPQRCSTSIPMGKINCLAKDKTRRLWIGTEEHGLFVQEANGRVVQFSKTAGRQNLINGNKINAIFCDQNGTGWVSVSTNGIYQLIPANGFTHYHEEPELKNHLSSNIVRCFMEDDEKNIWIATQGGGINVFDPSSQQFTSLTRKNLRGLPFDYIRCIVRDETNTAWIGTERGACRINLKSLQTEKIRFYNANQQRLADPYIEQIIPFSDRSWLIATKEHGLFQLKNEYKAAAQLPFPGNKHVFYTAFINGFLFVSVWDDDPKIFTEQSGQWKEVPNELTSFTITWVQHDKKRKRYWIGTLQGLVEADEQLGILRQYTMNDGLSNHYIYALLMDKTGLLWISTNRGLSLFDPDKRSFKVYTPEDGLQGYEYNAKAAFEASDGTLYFGGTNGFDAIRKNNQPIASAPATFYIKDLLVNNRPYPSQYGISFTKRIALAHTENNITIQTGVIDFVPRGSNKIRYKLQGIDRDWILADRGFSINYSGLPPGKYEFLATAANASGEWNPAFTRLTISIAEPWWQNGWFQACMIVFAGGLVVLFIRAYYQRKWLRQRAQMEKVKAIEQERTRIATDMHDDLGAGLSRIKFLSENIEWKHMQQQPVKEEIIKVKNYAHEMIDKMGEIVWALNEKNDSLTDLLAYTRAYAAEYLGQYGIQCRVSTPDQVPPLFVSGEFRRNVYLSVKEALHNVVKHAAATQVRIQVNINRQLEIYIADNGKGIERAKSNAFGNGLLSMSKRLAAIGGFCEVLSGEGTTVYLSAPLPH